MRKIALSMIALLPATLLVLPHLSEARSFSSRSAWGSSKSFSRPATPTSSAKSQHSALERQPSNSAAPNATANPAAAQTPKSSSPLGQKGIPGAERYRSLSQQAPSPTLKRAITNKANTGVKWTQLAMLYWLLSSSNTHASELTPTDRTWVENEIKDKEKKGEKLEEQPSQHPTAVKP